MKNREIAVEDYFPTRNKYQYSVKGQPIDGRAVMIQKIKEARPGSLYADLFACYRYIALNVKITSEERRSMIDTIGFRDDPQFIGKTDMDICKMFIRNVASDFYERPEGIRLLTLSLVPGDTEGGLIERLSCDSVAEVALTEILLFISRGSKAMDGTSIGFCAICGKEFLKEHGNKKYCPEHETNSARQKAFRDRKRQLKNNTTTKEV